MVTIKKTTGKSVKILEARKWNATKSDLATMSKDSDSYIRKLVASNCNSSAIVLQNLACAKEADVRASVAKNMSAKNKYWRKPLMKATGIVRRIDDLGRVVIPKEIRRTLRIREGDPLQTALTQWEAFCFAMDDLAKRNGWS